MPRIRFIPKLGCNVSGADAVATDVLSPRTFYSGVCTMKTGSMATQTLDPANENVPAGYYAATTLSAVDGDLAVGNIKDGVTIFGFLGTFTKTPTIDKLASAFDPIQTFDVLDARNVIASGSLTAGADATLVTTTLSTVTAGSTVIGVTCAVGGNSSGADDNKGKLQFLIGGVQVEETGFTNSSPRVARTLKQSREDLSGNIVLLLRIHNYGANYSGVYQGWSGIGGGSVKVA